VESNLSPAEAKNLAETGLADPGFFCRTFLGSWFEFKMPWVHRGILAILTGKADWLLKFGPEQWPKESAFWTVEELELIIKHFVWKAEPEDENSPVIPLFELEYEDGIPVAIHMTVSNRILLILPRGLGKTTLVNAHEIMGIVYVIAEFIVYLSETAEAHAEIQLGNIKRQLEVNALLRAIFGNKVPDRGASERWRQDIIETVDGIVVAARGRGGQVRGLNFNSKRPTEIIFDDVEDKESVKTDEQRLKVRKWLKADVEPALPQIEGSYKGRLIGLGTVLHHDSLLVNLSKDPEWITIIFGACLPGANNVDPAQDQMLWDRYLTRDAYLRRRRSYVRAGQLAEFNMEYNSSTKVEGDGAKFKSEYIRYQVMHRTEFVGVALAMDPAISEKKDSAFCAYGVVGMTSKGQMSIIDVYLQKGMHPREQIDKYFELHFNHKCTHHGIEAIGYQQSLIHLMKEEMFRKGKIAGPGAYFEIEPIRHGKTAKIPRVEGVLAPRYASGYITHQKRFPVYEGQLLDWPNAELDGPDVIAMAVTLLDPLAQFAYDPESDDERKLERDQFEPLVVNWSAP